MYELNIVYVQFSMGSLAQCINISARNSRELILLVEQVGFSAERQLSVISKG
jgi:hypothetical protein